jgi:GNAT superfamily N-acetyltransferase
MSATSIGTISVAATPVASSRPWPIPVTPPVALVAHPARTMWDAESLRLVRNSCREFMTGDNRRIATDEQAAWWCSEARRRNAIWLFVPPGLPTYLAVGFGLFRMEDGKWWATLGLLPAWRGQGHGVGIYRHLRDCCPGDLWIRVLLTNPGSARAAAKAGFVPVDSNGVYAEMVARRGV